MILLLLLPAPGPGGLGDGRVGDEVPQVGDGRHLGPDGGVVHPDGDPPVLVRAILHDVLRELGLPDLLGQVAPPLGQLEVYEHVGVGEVVPSLEVLAGHQASCEDLPGAAGLPIVDPDHVAGVGALLVDGMAGSDVTEGDVDARLVPDQA